MNILKLPERKRKQDKIVMGCGMASVAGWAGRRPVSKFGADAPKQALRATRLVIS